MKKVQIVVGSQFGDEGKGKTVQYLCQEALDAGLKPVVVRFCSGPQASHTVVKGELVHICSSLGSGVLLNVPTIIVPETDTLIDPIALHAEYDILVQKGITPKLYVDACCTIISPYDVIANRNNKESLENGTCGCGIWEALNRERNGCGELDIFDIQSSPEDYLEDVRSYHNLDKQEELEEQFIKDIEWLSLFATYDIEAVAEDYDVFIYESSQGLLLDGNYGLRPYITPCQIMPLRDFDNPTEFRFNLLCMYDKDDIEIEVYFVSRTYTTRHGGGYEPYEDLSQLFIKPPKFETNKTNQYQGKFKIGILDFDMMNRGVDRHCLDNVEGVDWILVINHVDCITDTFGYISKQGFHMVSSGNVQKTFLQNIHLPFKKVLYSETPESNFNEYTVRTSNETD